MVKKFFRNENGVTLVEVIVVLTIIAITSAIIVPNLANIVDKSKLQADVESAIAINNAVDLYNTESTSGIDTSSSVSSAIELLNDQGYLDDAYTDPQTNGAVWVFDANANVAVDISGCSNNVKDVYDTLSANEQKFVVQ